MFSVLYDVTSSGREFYVGDAAARKARSPVVVSVRYDRPTVSHKHGAKLTTSLITAPNVTEDQLVLIQCNATYSKCTTAQLRFSNWRIGRRVR